MCKVSSVLEGWREYLASIIYNDLGYPVDSNYDIMEGKQSIIINLVLLILLEGIESLWGELCDCRIQE